MIFHLWNGSVVYMSLSRLQKKTVEWIENKTSYSLKLIWSQRQNESYSENKFDQKKNQIKSENPSWSCTYSQQ